MVHALDEIRRVLAARGALIDLRPVLGRWPVEVAWPGGYREAGRATDLAESLSDDTAANAAVEETLARGGCVRRRQDMFAVCYYWAPPREMQAYIRDEGNDVIAVDDQVWRDLGTLWASAGAEARVRLRLQMLIARHQKQA